MENSLLSVGTITYAIKGRDILRESGIKASIARNTGSGSEMGCGYYIRFDGDREKAIEILRNAQIKIY